MFNSDHMDCSTPGFPVLHHLPEFAQTHVHWVCDAIQWSHPLSPLSSPALNLSQHLGLFQWVTFPIRWPKYWSFSFSISPSSEYSGLISFRIDCFDLLAVQGTLKSFLQHHGLKASILRHSAFFFREQISSVPPCPTSYRSLCWPGIACDGVGMAAWFWGSDLENSLAQRHQARFAQRIALPPLCFTPLSYFSVDSNPGGKRVLTSGPL